MKYTKENKNLFLTEKESRSTSTADKTKAVFLKADNVLHQATLCMFDGGVYNKDCRCVQCRHIALLRGGQCI